MLLAAPVVTCRRTPRGLGAARDGRSADAPGAEDPQRVVGHRRRGRLSQRRTGDGEPDRQLRRFGERPDPAAGQGAGRAQLAAASYRALYRLPNRKTVPIAPLEVADLHDHESGVTIAANLIQDPNGDPNAAQRFKVL